MAAPTLFADVAPQMLRRNKQTLMHSRLGQANLSTNAEALTGQSPLVKVHT
jgi:hypothetical protein